MTAPAAERRSSGEGGREGERENSGERESESEREREKSVQQDEDLLVNSRLNLSDPPSVPLFSPCF